jgi:hypothetical protein
MVSFGTSDGTASAGEDYVPGSGTVSFAPGEAIRTIDLEVLGDGQGEPDESFSVDLSAPVNAVLSDPNGVVTIENDDPILSIRVADVSVTEGNSGTTPATFTVTLSQPTSDPISARFTTGNLTAVGGLDYSATSGTLVFPPGETSTQVIVPVLGDVLYEPTERFSLDLTSDAVWVQDPRGVGTIQDDEAIPSISIGDVLVTEGNSGTRSAVLTLVLSGPSSGPVDVSYTTTNDTARAGPDYVADAGVLRFAPGTTQTMVSIQVIGDTVFESGERFFLDLSAPVGASIADGRGIVTIKNDDPKV